MIIEWSRVNYFILLCMVVYSCVSIPTRNKKNHNSKKELGYRIEGKEVVFEFDVRDYQKASLEGRHHELEFAYLNIQEVAVSGEFNEWSKEGWKMKKVDEHIYQLRKKLNDFDSKVEWQYKFVVNEKYWVEPPAEASNRVPYKPWDSKRHNFVMNTTQPKLIGNTAFQLKGYENANRVYLAGSFNNWQTKDILMDKTKEGWVCRVDLKEGKHLYKFVVDGTWIEDPGNSLLEHNEFGGFNSVLFKGDEPTIFKLKGFATARKVFLAGSFNKWSKHAAPCSREGDYWVYRLYLPPGKYQYKYIVDGRWHVDPTNPVSEHDGRGNVNSVRYIN